MIISIPDVAYVVEIDNKMPQKNHFTTVSLMKYLDHHKTKECSLAGNIFKVVYWQDIHYLLMCVSLGKVKMVSISKKVDTLARSSTKAIENLIHHTQHSLIWRSLISSEHPVMSNFKFTWQKEIVFCFVLSVICDGHYK